MRLRIARFPTLSPEEANRLLANLLQPTHFQVIESLNNQDGPGSSSDDNTVGISVAFALAHLTSGDGESS
jgi:hypothetical protein